MSVAKIEVTHKNIAPCTIFVVLVITQVSAMLFVSAFHRVSCKPKLPLLFINRMESHNSDGLHFTRVSCFSAVSFIRVKNRNHQMDLFRIRRGVSTLKITFTAIISIFFLGRKWRMAKKHRIGNGYNDKSVNLFEQRLQH